MVMTCHGMNDTRCPVCGLGDPKRGAQFTTSAFTYPMDRLEAAEQRGFRRGAEEMRERAAAMIDTSAHGSRWPERIRSLAIGRG